MSTKTTMVHARIDQDLKQIVEAYLSNMWLNTTTAIKIYFEQIVINKGLPFNVTLEANKKTKKVFKSTDQWKNLVKCDNTEEMFSKLDI